MAGKARGRKSIFITGAASGMGRETAKLFQARAGSRACSTSTPKGSRRWSRNWAATIASCRRLDVTDKADSTPPSRAFGEETGGKMDLLFSNAGIGESGWFEDVPFEAALRVVQVNLIGVLTSIYAALPLLKATPSSLVFITSSSSATYGMPRIAVYSATKHAVKGLTEALSVEFMRHGVRVADVLPGLIDTAILRSTPNRTGDRPKPSEEEFYANAPRKGMFRLLPASAWQRRSGRPMAATGCIGMCRQELVWIDRLKALFPRFTRGQHRQAHRLHDRRQGLAREHVGREGGWRGRGTAM